MAFRVGDGGPQLRPFQEWLNRKFASYSNIKIDEKYGLDEARVVAEAMRRYGLPPSFMTVKLSGVDTTVEGAVATDQFLARAGYRPPGRRYPIQGVFANSNAFMQPDPNHSYVQATDEFMNEGFRLYSGMVGTPIVPIGYSMGGDSVRKFLNRLPVEWRQYVKMAVTFGDPSMPPAGSLLGDRPGAGISGVYQPDWVWDRYYSFAIEGDWYPQARGLLPFFYQMAIRAAVSMDFALYLFTVFPMQAMQELLGLTPSADPLAGVLAPLAGLLTTGPTNTVGQLLNPMGIFGVLWKLVELMTDAIKFLKTNAHFMYGDPAHALWDGMTGVDKAAQLIREKVPTATLFLFPGTWAFWDQGFPMDVAVRLQ